MKITVQNYGKLPDGKQALMYILENNNNMRVHITNFGGVITNIFVPDKSGELTDVTLGHNDFESYIKNSGYLGALVGRNCNRIKNAEFTIGEKKYKIDRNDGKNNLHGGKNGMSYRLFSGEVRTLGNLPALLLSCTVDDMSDDFPGNLIVNIAYALTNDNALMIDYRAVCDVDTVINLTNHTYFNLAGHNSGTILDHVVELNADYYMPNTEDGVPNGEIRSVDGTAFDFRTAKPIGKDMDFNDDQIKMFGGYDNNFVLGGGYDYRKVATVTEPLSGRRMTVYTDLPGIQFYTANMLDPSLTYKGGAKYVKHQGFCLETQLFPNAVNMPWLASPIYHAGEEYITTTTYQFD